MFGKTRQAWYKRRDTEEAAMQQDAVIVREVRRIRAVMPRIGTRKLQYMLTEVLDKHGIAIGRDKLFNLLEEYGLLVRKRKRRKAYATNSIHPFRKYPNMVRGMEVLRPNHLWVSDMTYISLPEGFCYLSLVTDAYSRKIVGYCLYPNYKRYGPINALQMALAGYKKKLGAVLIHHSDRGLQYCCTDYISLLGDKGLSISMTEQSDPYENAIAERVNGILKDEFGLGKAFGSFEQASNAVDRAVDIYNNQRPHASCNYLTPQQASGMEGSIPMKWKRKQQKVEEIIIHNESGKECKPKPGLSNQGVNLFQDKTPVTIRK